MTHDPLTDILKVAGARCALSGSLAAGGAWAVHFPPPGLIKVIAVVRGACWLAVEGEMAPLRLERGDVVMVPVDRPFRLAGELGAPSADGVRLFANSADKAATIGDGRDFLSIGVHVELADGRGDVLADVLPPLLHVDGHSSGASAMRWLLDQLMAELATQRPGALLASEQLAQLLFVQMVRAHLADSRMAFPGWVGVLGDERMARALRLMHQEPGRAWRLAELAKAAGMSRTSFAVRFKAAAGVAPLTYLTRWRMRLAERGLRDGTMPVSALAYSLGYSSESAFSCAFKRATGMGPQRYRSAARGR